MNTLTQKFYYNTKDTSQNMRLVMSSPGLERPVVWEITKIESAQPIGVNKITLYQTEWNSDTDYVDKEAISNGDLFAYYANYYASDGNVAPEEPENKPIEDNSLSSLGVVININTSNTTIKIGGSYKTLTAIVSNNGEDITDSFTEYVWNAFIDNVPAPTDFLTWSDGPTPNIKKIKLAKIRKYIGKTLTVTCAIKETLSGETQLNIGAL